MSGSVAERVNVYTYVCFSILMFGFIYPLIAAWTWGRGWLYNFGYEDFAGSGVVHITGGFAGLMGAVICGPRLGRFEDMRTGEAIASDSSTQVNQVDVGRREHDQYAELHRKFMSREIEIEHVHSFVRTYVTVLEERNFAASSPGQVALGTLILWVGWLFFNGGSTLGLTGR